MAAAFAVFGSSISGLVRYLFGRWVPSWQQLVYNKVGYILEHTLVHSFRHLHCGDTQPDSHPVWVQVLRCSLACTKEPSFCTHPSSRKSMCVASLLGRFCASPDTALCVTSP